MVVVMEKFVELYEESKLYWKYQNLFSREDWVFTIINYPNNSHWIFLAMHLGDKVVFVKERGQCHKCFESCSGVY